MENSQEKKKVNKKILTFQENAFKRQIKGNEAVIETICVGNKGKQTMKFQFSMKQESYKYKLRTEPEVVVFKQGEASEFSQKQ